MTRAEALALLDEAEALLPPPGEGLPTFRTARRLEEIATALLTDAPRPVDRVVMRASTIRNVAHRWGTAGRIEPGGAEERAKWLVRRDLGDLRRALEEGGVGRFDASVDHLGWLAEKLGGWLQP